MKSHTPTRGTGPYTIDCPECGAAPDVPCTNPITGQPYRYHAPHIQRVRAAQKDQPR